MMSDLLTRAPKPRQDRLLDTRPQTLHKALFAVGCTAALISCRSETVCPRVPDNFIRGAVSSCAEAQTGGIFGKRDQLLTAAATVLQGEWRRRGREGKAGGSCDNVTAFFQLSSCGTALTSKPNASPRTTSRKQQLGLVSTRHSRRELLPRPRGSHLS